jgi:hypothetical protein
MNLSKKRKEKHNAQLGWSRAIITRRIKYITDSLKLRCTTFFHKHIFYLMRIRDTLIRKKKMTYPLCSILSDSFNNFTWIKKIFKGKREKNVLSSISRFRIIIKLEVAVLWQFWWYFRCCIDFYGFGYCMV